MRQLIPKDRAQLSIEYLMLFAFMLALLLLVSNSIDNIYNNALLSIDTKNAELFAQKMKNSISALELYGEGSQIKLSAKILTSWKVDIKNTVLEIEVQNKKLQKSKKIRATLSAETNAVHNNFSESLTFIIRKEQQKISIEYS